MGKLIPFPSGPDLLAAKAQAGKRLTDEQSLYKLSRFYIKMNSLTDAEKVFTQRTAKTALEFVEQVCETIGYHVPGTIEPPQGAD